MAFRLVNRITALGAQDVRGIFVVPTFGIFPESLMAEAVGQLAAWAAMERCGFKRRPVAAIAARVTVRRAPAPGAELNLAVEIESCDETAIAYNGTAADASGPLLELEGSVGPMMPADEFDDPSELRKYFDQLTTTGVVDGLDRSALAEPNLTFGSCIEDKV